MRRAIPIVIALIAGSLLTAPRAAAFEVTDCNVILQSFDAEGNPLDTAIGDDTGGEGGTHDDPFLIDFDGSVRYQADTGDQVITDHRWSVDVFLLPTPIRGGDPNPEEETMVEGEVEVSAVVPTRVTGLFFISGQIAGEGGSCRGNGWLRVVDEEEAPPSTLPFWIALLIMAVGALTLWVARPRLVAPVAYREVR